MDGFLSPRRQANLERFLTLEIIPYPLRDAEFSWSVLWQWMADIWMDRGWEAVQATLWIAVLAMMLAGGTAWVLHFGASRSLLAREPFTHSGDRRTGNFWIGSWVVQATRLLCILMRAVPEYVWAFLLLALLGPNSWPVVIALAIHNAGILGRLWADALDNAAPGPLRALSMAGASRRQCATTVIPNHGLSKYLLYFFYRFETCLREATVLGMLGVVSLGYWIKDARTRQLYDELFFLVSLGALLVFLVDFISYFLRRRIRRN